MTRLIVLESWALSRFSREPRPCLIGYVSGHPNHADGRTVMTSQIDHVLNGNVVTQSGTNYVLGETDPRYLELTGGLARRALLERLTPESAFNWEFILHTRYVLLK